MHQLHTILKTSFGYDSFRGQQEEIITSVLSGQDTVVLMPTGGGKSLCFQVPAIFLGKVTLVISPLIALMKDQVDALKANGVGAEFLNSTLSREEETLVEERLREGEVQLLYVSPERLALPDFQRFLQELPVALIAVDEAHCISEWGHEFRSEYRNLSLLRTLFPTVPVIALTATATPRVQSDIVSQLGMNKPKVFLSSFNRENLHYSVRPKRKALEQVVELLEQYKKESVIVYCLSRKDTERVAKALTKNGIPAKAYHAGMSAVRRQKVQEGFQRDKVKVIVATIAFGMGIDKSNVRLVVHYHLPKSVEGYYQETGRAGRDGLPSSCILFYSAGDIRQLEYFILRMDNPEEQKNAREKLQQMLSYAESMQCRRGYLLQYFGEDWTAPSCGNCDVCTTERKEFDATILAQKLLSAVIKTGERFGLLHVVSVLRGSKKANILSWKHNALSVYGIGKDHAQGLWVHVGEELLRLGYLQKVPLSAGGHVLTLTVKGKTFLKNREILSLSQPLLYTPEVPKNVAGREGLDTELFERLRTLRKELAEARNVPSFIIFSDKTLWEMVEKKPSSLREMGKISGVGEQKLKELAPKFLEVLCGQS